MNWFRWALVAALVLPLRALWLPELFPPALCPDLLVLFILWTALRGYIEVAMISALLLGMLFDAAMLSPIPGITTLGLLAVAYLPAALESHLLTGNRITGVFLAALAVLLAEGIRYMFYQGAGLIPQGTPFLFSSLLWDRLIVTTLTALPLFWLFDGTLRTGATGRMDRRSHAATYAR